VEEIQKELDEDGNEVKSEGSLVGDDVDKGEGQNF
jgi:hypothetical protein